METVLLNAGILKRFIVIRLSRITGNAGVGNANNGQVTFSEQSVFSPLVKIEVERSTRNPNRYVHLRLCHTNKYWGRTADVGSSQVPLVANSSEPDEDMTKLSSTLFEPVRVAGNPESFYLVHVQSGGYVMGLTITTRLWVRMHIPNPVTVDPSSMHLTSVNWEELVKLPKMLALKGHNDKYLGGRRRSNTNSLELRFDEAKARESMHEVHLMNDGHVRIKSIFFDRFWRRNPSNNWIVADATNTTASVRDRDTLFWPIHNRNEGDTIVLRNAGNNQFCIADNSNFLVGTGRTMTSQTKLTAEELVYGRKIYNVRYRVGDSRVFNQAPYVAGSTTAQNTGNTEANVFVEITYEESRSESFSRSTSIEAGVTMSIEAGVPLISKVGIEFSMSTTMTKEWNKTETKTVSIKANGSVPVPPRSVATISYVGTRGTCDVPFSYTQQQFRATDGVLDITEEIDGVFTGVNSYDFNFIITGTRSLPLPREALLPDSEAQ